MLACPETLGFDTTTCFVQNGDVVDSGSVGPGKGRIHVLARGGSPSTVPADAAAPPDWVTNDIGPALASPTPCDSTSTVLHRSFSIQVPVAGLGNQGRRTTCSR